MVPDVEKPLARLQPRGVGGPTVLGRAVFGVKGSRVKGFRVSGFRVFRV